LLFAASCFTDWLDGYLARLLDASTPFGAFLDPVADKLTVAAALVLLCTRAPLAPSPLAAPSLAWVVPFSSIAIIGREISMSALREWAASLGPEARATVAVGGLGKIKTAAQMAAITLLLLTRDGGASAAAVGLSAGAFEAAARLGPPLLMVATVLTKWSLWQYLRAMWPWISGKKQGVVV
jgi:CDP-diacylglycerol--glycerol-3-phosphate 3-phosphatidyltransferase